MAAVSLIVPQTSTPLYPTTLIGSAVEEIARFDTSVPFFFFRVAREDLTIGDRLIPMGSVVALGLGAANHDPAVFEAPQAFEITRTPNPHIAVTIAVSTRSFVPANRTISL